MVVKQPKLWSSRRGILVDDQQWEFTLPIKDTIELRNRIVDLKLASTPFWRGILKTVANYKRQDMRRTNCKLHWTEYGRCSCRVKKLTGSYKFAIPIDHLSELQLLLERSHRFSILGHRFDSLTLLLQPTELENVEEITPMIVKSTIPLLRDKKLLRPGELILFATHRGRDSHYNYYLLGSNVDGADACAPINYVSVLSPLECLASFG